jgi:putative DNA primase/helicase
MSYTKKSPTDSKNPAIPEDDFPAVGRTESQPTPPVDTPADGDIAAQVDDDHGEGVDAITEHIARIDPDHLADLRKSGLTDTTITQARLMTITDPGIIARLLRSKHGPDAARKYGTCLAIPYHNINGETIKIDDATGQNQITYVKLRLGVPIELDNRDPATGRAKTLRYLAPRDTPWRVYFPPGVGQAVADPGHRLFITEGEKKALKAKQEGYPCIALPGVWNFAAERPEDAHSKPVGPRKLCDDLAQIAWQDRPVYIVYDSDAATKESVRRAEKMLADVLADSGAKVCILRLPHGDDGTKCGLDDYLVAKGNKALDALIVNADLDGIVSRFAAIEAVDNPHRLARRFMISEGYGAEGDPSKLRRYRGEFVAWDAHYSAVADENIANRMNAFARQEMVDDHRRRLAAYVAAQAEKTSGDDGKKTKAEKLPEIKPVTTSMVANAVAALRSMTDVADTTDASAWLDDATGPSPRNLIPFTNGILDHTDGRMYPLSPSLLTFAGPPYDYDPAAPAPALWLATLGQIFPDGESIDLLQEWAGYILTSDTSRQKFLMLIGESRGGKGLIARVLTHLVGPGNCASPTLTSLTERFGCEPLLNKTLAVIADARVSNRTDTAITVEKLLSIVGEDAHNVDRKNKTAIYTRLPTRFMVASNEIPRLPDASGALANRMLMLRFTVSFLGKEDETLADRIIGAEMPGIANWALAGLRRLRRNRKFTQPGNAMELLQDARDIASPVAMFLREECILSASAATSAKVLYDAYKRWSEDNGRDHIESGQIFAKNLKAAHQAISTQQVRRDGDRVRQYVGIRLRQDSDPYDDVKPQPTLRCTAQDATPARSPVSVAVRYGNQSTPATNRHTGGGR